MRLVERDHELGVLERLLAACQEGRGNVAVISGTVACGKSALIQSFAERATEAGAILLSAVASRAERTLPLGLLGQLFCGGNLPPEITERAARVLNDPALTAMLHEPEPENFARVTARLFDRLHRLLTDLARCGPVVITIDDVEYADPLSHECLQYVIRRSWSSKMLLVLSVWTDLLAQKPMLYAEFLSLPDIHRIRLAPLPQRGVETLLARQLDPATARLLAPCCHALSGGNPLLVRALIEDYQAGGMADSARLVFGDAAIDAVLTCLYRCGPTLARLAQAIAVLGPDACPALLSELLDLDPDSAALGVSTLSAAGILDDGRFRHDAARQAVLAGVSTEERAALHSKVAEVLHGHGAPAPILARHLIAADRIGSGWAVPVLQEAAKLALADFDTGTAISYLRRAHRGCGDARQRATVKLALARAEWRINPASALRHMPDLVTAAREGVLTAEQANTVVYQLLWFGHTRDAASVLASFPASAPQQGGDGQPGDPRVRLWLGSLFPGFAGAVNEAGGFCAGAIAAGLSEAGLKEAALLASILSGNGTEDTLIAAEQILQSRSLDESTLPAIASALIALVCADRLDRAAYWCRSLLPDAAERSVPLWHALLAAVSAMIEICRGDLLVAENHAHLALTLLAPAGWGVAIGLPLSSMLYAASAAGKYDDASAYRGIAVPEAMFLTLAGAMYTHARGHYYLACDRPHAAIADFETCGELMVRWGIDHPGLIPWRTDAAQALVRMGRRAQARELSMDQIARIGPGHNRARGISLRVLALASRAEKRVALLREAIECLQRSGDRLELTYALADLSVAHAELGEYSKAQAIARKADQLAARCKAEPVQSTLLTAAGRLKQDGPVRAGGTDTLARLSDAERRVAVLAAHGYTNQQISRKLHVTVSTVEQHLTKVYRKLGVGRADLPIELHDDSRA